MTLIRACGVIAGITCASFALSGKLAMSSWILSVAWRILPLAVTTFLFDVPVCLNPVFDCISELEGPESNNACCIASFGMEEGSEEALKGETFALRTGEPVQFTFLSSSTRQEDTSGVVLEDWDEDEIEPASTMEITLDAEPGMESPIPVQLGARVTEVGTLELYFENPSSGKRWSLEYQVRESD